MNATEQTAIAYDSTITIGVPKVVSQCKIEEQDGKHIIKPAKPPADQMPFQIVKFYVCNATKQLEPMEASLAKTFTFFSVDKEGSSKKGTYDKNPSMQP